MNEIDDLLAASRGADLLRDAVLADPSTEIAKRVRRRERRLIAFASAGVLAVAVGVTGFIVAVGSSTDQHHHGQATGSAGSSGLTVSATGVVVAVGARVDFCHALAQLRGSANLRNQPPSCVAPIKATNVNLAELADRRRVGPATVGSAQLEGVLSGNTLRVTMQGPPQAVKAPHDVASPPCSVPTDGWGSRSSLVVSRAARSYERRYRGDIVADSLVPAGGSPAVLVVASAMPSRTKAQLGRELPDQICVVQSQFSIAQTRNAVQTLSALAKDNSNGILAISPGQTTAGQPEVSLEAVKATGTIQRTISNLPSGLVRQSYWLTVRPGQ